MKTYIATLQSTSPLGFNKFIPIPKNENERDEAFENRVWRERCHADHEGHVILPPMWFKRALESTAKYRGDKIRGKGKATLTKYFERSVVVRQGITLPNLKSTIEGEWVMVPVDGKIGGGRRVPKCFPRLNNWTGQIEITVLDDTVQDIDLERHLITAGQLNGIGFWRPERRGLWGKFILSNLEMTSEE